MLLNDIHVFCSLDRLLQFLRQAVEGFLARSSTFHSFLRFCRHSDGARGRCRVEQALDLAKQVAGRRVPGFALAGTAWLLCFFGLDRHRLTLSRLPSAKRRQLLVIVLDQTLDNLEHIFLRDKLIWLLFARIGICRSVRGQIRA